MRFEAYCAPRNTNCGGKASNSIRRSTAHRQLGIDKDEAVCGAALIVAGAFCCSNFNVLSIDLGRLSLSIISAGVWLLKKRREKAPS
jgi:hypothetical protein